jgi:hypothetical protein
MWKCGNLAGVSEGATERSERRRRAPKNGAEDWNRTSDTSIFSAVLYQLSYLGTLGRGYDRSRIISWRNQRQ